MSDDESVEIFDSQQRIEKLKSWRKNINWQVEGERYEFLRKIEPLLRYWVYEYPNLQEIFRTEEIECLLLDSINNLIGKQYDRDLGEFFWFVLRIEYKDKREVDIDGKPSSRRTTPVHHAARLGYQDIIGLLFTLYSKCDVNYTDELGHTHFHVACEFGLDHVIKRFLELGHDPNCLLEKSSSFDPPLFLALKHGQNMIVELLRRIDFDPNLVNKDGSTPLHMISQNTRCITYVITGTKTYFAHNMAKTLFELNNEKYQPVQIDARDKLGNTPLHVAVKWENKEMIEFLLRKGANPNLANEEGSTALHHFYMLPIVSNSDSIHLFFKICDEKQQLVMVDAKDKLGRTPLQWAVANLWPDCIDILFEHGADLSNFVFPAENYFAERFNSWKYETRGKYGYRFHLASRALAVVELIVKRGYQFDRSDVLTVMKFFAKHGMFEKSDELKKSGWYDEGKKVSYKDTKKVMISPSVSLYDLTRLQPEKAEKLLTYTDYWKFTFHYCICENYYEPCDLHLCEKLSRGFFLHWALDLFWELIHKRLPLEICEMILEQLTNEDLCHICLTATLQSSKPH
uniref:Uncharacterized protein n=1 Tax=Trichogramma kaykai TaxID=54128 RepID=A0ABD2WLG1_9HYME